MKIALPFIIIGSFILILFIILALTISVDLIKVFLPIGIVIFIIMLIIGIVYLLKEKSEKFNDENKNIKCRKGRCRCFGKNKKWKEYNKQELKKIVDELKKANKHPFLCGGNLLGYGRQKDLLDNDDDLNLALFDDEYDEKVDEIIKKLGYTLKTHKTNKGKQLTINKGIDKNDTDVEIDIGIWFRRDNWYYFFTKFTSKGEQYKITPFDLVLTNVWDDFLIYIPSNYKQVLYDNYGNWEKSDPNFKYPDDAPGYVKDNVVEPVSNQLFLKIIEK